MITKPRATIEDLYNVPDNAKAELVRGELVLMSPTGYKPGRAGFKIAMSLARHEEEHGGGRVIPDNVAFVVDLPHRQSFSPDAAWHTGEEGTMKFLTGAPAFAVGVRSEGDYGPSADRAIAEKIADYFAAGTLVVWDVDLLDSDVIKVYRKDSPNIFTVYGPGNTAEAEPAVPGWQFPVELLFK